MKTLTKTLVFGALLAVFVLAVSQSPVQARALLRPPPVQPYIDEPVVSPASITLSDYEISLAPGEEITVTVTLHNIEDLYAGDVQVSYDPAVVEGIKVAKGVAPYPDFVVRCVADNVTGKTWYAVSQLNPRPPFYGSGVMYTVRFRGKVAQETPLQFSYIKLVDRRGARIPVEIGE